MPQIHTQALNLHALFELVRKKLSETTASYWTDLEIYNALNRGQQNIARKAKCLEKEVTVTTIDDTATYDLRVNGFSDIIDIAEDGVHFYMNGTTYQPLTFKTKKQLNMEFPGWQGVSASVPQYYYWNRATKTIGLYPKPNSTNAGAYLFINGYHFPKVLLGGLASSGTTSQIVFPAGSATVMYPNPVDDYYNNLYIEIQTGTGAGQKVKITDYTASTRTALATFTTAPDATSYFGMVPEIPEEAHNLMYLFALGENWGKGGSRTTLGDYYRRQYYEELGVYIGEELESDDEDLIKDTYR